METPLRHERSFATPHLFKLQHPNVKKIPRPKLQTLNSHVSQEERG